MPGQPIHRIGPLRKGSAPGSGFRPPAGEGSNETRPLATSLPAGVVTHIAPARPSQCIERRRPALLERVEPADLNHAENVATLGMDEAGPRLARPSHPGRSLVASREGACDDRHDERSRAARANPTFRYSPRHRLRRNLPFFRRPSCRRPFRHRPSRHCQPPRRTIAERRPAGKRGGGRAKTTAVIFGASAGDGLQPLD